MSTDFRRALIQDETVGAGDFFHRFAESCKDSDATILVSDASIVVGATDYGTELSVATFRAIVEQLAGWFSEQGVSPRTPVGVFVADSPLYYLYYVALCHIGAIAVLLNSNMPGGTAADYLRRVGCLAVVVDALRARRLEPHRSVLADANGNGPKLLTPESVQPGGGAPPVAPYSYKQNDVVLIAHTSGTTGSPKPVQFNHAGYFFGVRQQMFHVLGRKVLSALPHSHGSAITMFMSTVIRGMPLFAQTDKSPRALLQSIAGWKPNLVMAFPKPLVDLCRVDLDVWDLSSVSCWMSTGDASHEPHIRRLTRYGTRVRGSSRLPGSLYIDNLGSSEFAFGILRNVHAPETDSYDRCIGRPFEWVGVQIFGEDGRPVGVNEVGRLGVKSASVTSGYWQDAATTRKTLLDGYWLTGDLVFRDESGLYYHVDRTPDRTLIANRALYSCQLEELVLKHLPEVFDCTIVCVSDPGHEPVLAVAVEPVDSSCDPATLRERIQTLLAGKGMRLPVRVELIAQGWNEGLTGKKLKRVIRDSFNRDSLESAGSEPAAA
jgi:acyl-coenzyme A synthetase/AMP-(fatty) acid ligase